MQVRSIAASFLATLVSAVGACLSPPSCAQTAEQEAYGWVTAPSPFAAGMASGMHFGAQVSAMYPGIRCSGVRSFTCGAHFSARPILAGALLGGLIGALSSPVHYGPTPWASEARPPVGHDSFPASSAAGASIADRWQEFGRDPRPASNASAPFVESWQRFFEPSR